MLSGSVTRLTFLAPITIVLFLAISAATQDAGVRGRRANAPSAAEATVTINEQFLNSFLQGIFDNLQEPSMPLTIDGRASAGGTDPSNGNGCGREIKLKREVNGTRTAVHFENGRIAGPLAFTGSYNSSLLGCIQFSGWANAEVELAYDRDRRALVARIQMREISLNDVPAIASGPLLNLVQTAIDAKYNPLVLFTLEQVSSRVNIPPAGGALQLRATEIRPEITPNALTLHILYEFVKAP